MTHPERRGGLGSPVLRANQRTAAVAFSTSLYGNERCGVLPFGWRASTALTASAGLSGRNPCATAQVSTAPIR